MFPDIWNELIWCCLQDSRPHTHNASTGSCQTTHLLLGKTIITSVNWTLQTRHTVDRGDTDTYYFVMTSDTYLIITVLVANKATFAFHKVVRRHYSQFSGVKFPPGYCTPKIIDIDSVFTELFKIYCITRGCFWDAVYTYVHSCR